MNMLPPLVDIHTHRKHTDGRIFIRNAYLPSKRGRNKSFPYPVSCGIHPWYISEHYENELAMLQDCLQQKEVVAIGECGLDYFKGPDPEIQKKILAAQLKLAAVFELPVILHMVRSLHDLIPLIKTHRHPVIIHDYNGSPQMTEQLLKEGIYFSFGNYFLKNKDRMKDTTNIIPPERLFAETDVHGYHVSQIYSRIAEAASRSEEQVREQIYSNFIKVFKRYDAH